MPKRPRSKNVWKGDAVDFLPARCPSPKCRSQSCRILHGPVRDDPARRRYHECRVCGMRFPSVEVLKNEGGKR